MIGNHKERIEALEWGVSTLRSLVTTRRPEDRDDATLIVTAMAELASGLEPRSVAGRPTNPERPWVAVPEGEKRLVWLADEYRKAVKRATRSGKRPDWELVSIEEYLKQLHLVRQDEWGDYLDPERIDWELLDERWRDVVEGAELNADEARAIYLRIGQGIPAKRAAHVLDVTQYQVERRLRLALTKVQRWIESRGWEYDTFMEG